MTIHLIPNSHLDPVWLWTWKEGTAEVISTMRTILNLMKEEPEVTYIRGEAWTYEILERYAPELFDQIAPLVEAGRWDIVGGNYIQPDTNLPHVESLLRQFSVGQEYFQRHFGRKATVAWAADSFGHAAGWPEIYATAGLRRFAFSRPSASLLKLPENEPGFHWIGDGGSKILCHRLPIAWYGNERDDLPRRLDETLRVAQEKEWLHVPVYFGLGNHGGGPTRRHLRDIQGWRRRHPNIDLRFSHLTGFFDAWETAIMEGQSPQPPEFRGELNYCNRGCYSSAAGIKFAYRGAENALLRAERVATATTFDSEKLTSLWHGLLFNAFHDILPGSSIEKACEQQRRQIDGLRDGAETLEANALLTWARRIDFRMAQPKGDHPAAVPHLIFNSHPRHMKTWVEIESNLDYRPLLSWKGDPGRIPLEVRDARGRRIRYQRLERNNFMRRFPWRVRLLVEVDLPALGWTVVTIGLGKRFVPEGKSPVKWAGNVFRFGSAILRAKPGSRLIAIQGEGFTTMLRVACFDDPWGAWGDPYEEKEATRIRRILGKWILREAKLIERGPHRAALWTSWSGVGGSLELTLRVCEGEPAIQAEGRLLFDHRRGRIKLLLAAEGMDQAEFEVPGGRIMRQGSGEVPGGRWVRPIAGSKPSFVFASDSFYNFDLEKDQLGVTVVRASRHGADQSQDKEDSPWNPAIDRGSYQFAFRLAPGRADADLLADILELPPIVQMVDAHAGSVGRRGSVLEVLTPDVRLLALKLEGQTVVGHFQSHRKKPTALVLRWKGKLMRGEQLHPGRIVSLPLL